MLQNTVMGITSTATARIISGRDGVTLLAGTKISLECTRNQPKIQIKEMPNAP